MRKVLFIKSWEDYKKGEVAFVENNQAHYLIDKKIAKLEWQDKKVSQERYASSKLRTRNARKH